MQASVNSSLLETTVAQTSADQPVVDTSAVAPAPFGQSGSLFGSRFSDRVVRTSSRFSDRVVRTFSENCENETVARDGEDGLKFVLRSEFCVADVNTTGILSASALRGALRRARLGLTEVWVERSFLFGDTNPNPNSIR